MSQSGGASFPQHPATTRSRTDGAVNQSEDYRETALTPRQSLVPSHSASGLVSLYPRGQSPTSLPEELDQTHQLSHESLEQISTVDIQPRHSNSLPGSYPLYGRTYGSPVPAPLTVSELNSAGSGSGSGYGKGNRSARATHSQLETGYRSRSDVTSSSSRSPYITATSTSSSSSSSTSSSDTFNKHSVYHTPTALVTYSESGSITELPTAYPSSSARLMVHSNSTGRNSSHPRSLQVSCEPATGQPFTPSPPSQPNAYSYLNSTPQFLPVFHSEQRKQQREAATGDAGAHGRTYADCSDSDEGDYTGRYPGYPSEFAPLNNSSVGHIGTHYSAESALFDSPGSVEANLLLPLRSVFEIIDSNLNSAYKHMNALGTGEFSTS